MSRDWTADPRPLAECLRDWASQHGVTWGVARWLSEQTGAPQRTLDDWLQRRRQPAAAADGPIRRLMMTIDAG